MTKKNRISQQSSVYAIGIILQHIISVIMLPIYTRFLLPEDYGLADLMSMGVEVIGLIVGVVTTQAIFRFYFEIDSDKHRHSVAFTVFVFSVALNAIGYLFILLTSSYSAEYLFGSTAVENGRLLVAMYGATILFQVMSAVPLSFIRAEQNAQLFVAFSALRLLLGLIFNIYFVVYKELHIVGVVYAVFSYTAIHALILSAYLVYKTRIRWSNHIAKKAIVFSWPLMLSGIALFLTTFSDRLFIKHYLDLNSVGLYALAYKFGFILIGFAWTPFAMAWESKRYEIVKQPDAIPVFQSVFRLTQMFVFLCALGLAVFTQDILRIMAAPNFHEAYHTAGILIFCHIFNIWSHFCMFGILYANKTIYRAYIDWFIFGFTIALYYLLIPSFGLIGAASATALSLLVRFLLILVITERLYAMRLPWARVVSSGLVAVALYTVSYWVQLPLLYSLTFNAGILLVYLAYSYFGVGLIAEDRRWIRSNISGLFNRFRQAV